MKKEVIIGVYQNSAKDFIELNYPYELYHLQADVWRIINISTFVFSIHIIAQFNLLATKTISDCRANILLSLKSPILFF